MAVWPNALHTLRGNANLTQVKLAAALHVDESTINRWEKGKTSIPYPALIKLAAVLQVAPIDIYPFLAMTLVPLKEDDTP